MGRVEIVTEMCPNQSYVREDTHTSYTDITVGTGNLLQEHLRAVEPLSS